MNIGIFGTGIVGRTLAGALAARGHAVLMGTRDPAATRARTERDGYGNPPVGEWLGQTPGVSLGTFADAATHGDLLINATNGDGTLAALAAAGDAALDGKVLIDVSNPLDFSRGFPPSLSVCNTDSLAEQIQRAHPALRVVKSLNTVTAALMVNPALVPGDHVIFVAGNDPAARDEVAAFLRDEFGWRNVTDLGDLTAARSLEMWLPLWLRLMGALGTPVFNMTLVKA